MPAAARRVPGPQRQGRGRMPARRTRQRHPASSLTRVLSVTTAFALAAALACCGAPAGSTPSGLRRARERHRTAHGASGLPAAHDPAAVTYSRSLSACQYRGSGQLPARPARPVRPAARSPSRPSPPAICLTGYAEKVRPPESEAERATPGIACLACDGGVRSRAGSITRSRLDRPHGTAAHWPLCSWTSSRRPPGRTCADGNLPPGLMPGRARRSRCFPAGCAPARERSQLPPDRASGPGAPQKPAPARHGLRDGLDVNYN